MNKMPLLLNIAVLVNYVSTGLRQVEDCFAQ